MTDPAFSPVAPRPAASLLVVQRQPCGPPRVLMGRRSAAHRFLPGMLVFPGGAVDQADYAAPVASELAPDVLAALARGAPPALAHALAAAAARELHEEVGLSLGDPPSLAHLTYLCRAITPPDRAIRFDARFFVVDAAHVSGQLRASAEIEQPGFYGLAEAISAQIPLATRMVLELFNQKLYFSDQRTDIFVLRDRKWCKEGDESDNVS